MMARATPQVRNDVLSFGRPDQGDSLRVGSDAWWDWLDHPETPTFHFSCPLGSFTARRERTKQGLYWYAYSRQEGKLHKAYLGKSADLTLERLRSVAQAVAARP